VHGVCCVPLMTCFCARMLPTAVLFLLCTASSLINLFRCEFAFFSRIPVCCWCGLCVGATVAGIMIMLCFVELIPTAIQLISARVRRAFVACRRLPHTHVHIRSLTGSLV
jgi:hypothetical protein